MVTPLVLAIVSIQDMQGSDLALAHTPRERDDNSLRL